MRTITMVIGRDGRGRAVSPAVAEVMLHQAIAAAKRRGEDEARIRWVNAGPEFLARWQERQLAAAAECEPSGPQAALYLAAATWQPPTIGKAARKAAPSC